MKLAIHHVGIRVRDLEQSISFYQEHFGFTEVSRDRLASGVEICFLAAPAGEAQLELIVGAHDHHPGDGLVHHLAFIVEDVAVAYQALARAGVTMIEAAPQRLPNGRELFSCRGPDGERLQLVSG
jgi:lactoylglutathione lyase